jgi:4,5:9,10-diseco-3-hydroxy-5,9,17-trioxoandrosta-1(10),2-diene-4-oate hydrolase
MGTGYGSRVGTATLLSGFRQHVAEIRGLRTEYWVGGEGPPLLLVHGLGGAAVNFTRLAPLLARRRRVLVADLPGHGGTEPGRVDSVGDLAAHVAAVAEHEGMLPAAVLGNSMGGLVGLRLAVSRPEAVSALVLVAPAGIISSTRRAQVWLAATGFVKPARKAARIRTVVARYPRLRYPVFGMWGAAEPRSLTEEAVHGFLEGPSRHTDLNSSAKALLNDDPRADLHGLRCRTLLVWGARDRLVPLTDGFEYARRLRCPIRVVPAAGHLIVGERPEACAELVESFLAATPPPDR